MLKEKRYYIIHINYSVNRAYIFSYRKTRIFTTNQAWKFVEDINNSSKIDGRILINNRSIREIEDYIEKNYLADCNFDNTKTIFLTTLAVSDERGNDIEDYTAAEKKYEKELNLLLDENSVYDYPGNINVVDVNSFSELDQEEIDNSIYEEASKKEEINDSSAIEQELVDSEKELVTEDFVKFEEFLKYKIDRVSLLEIIKDYFPCCETHLKRHGRIEVTTRFGTFFTLIPEDYDGINDFSIREHKYNISLCVI